MALIPAGNLMCFFVMCCVCNVWVLDVSGRQAHEAFIPFHCIKMCPFTRLFQLSSFLWRRREEVDCIDKGKSMAGEKVVLHVYDLSNGLARQLSATLLGKQVRDWCWSASWMWMWMEILWKRKEEVRACCVVGSQRFVQGNWNVDAECAEVVVDGLKHGH